MTFSLLCSLYLVSVFSSAGIIGTPVPAVTATTFDEVAPSPAPPMATVITNQSTGLSTYTNELYGITFDFPADWPVGQEIVAQDQLLHITPPNEESNRIPQTSKTGTGFTLTASIINPSSYLDSNTLQVKTVTPTARDFAIQQKTTNAETEAATASPSESWLGGILSNFFGIIRHDYVKDSPTIVSNETNAWRLDTIMNDDNEQIEFDSNLFIIHNNMLYRLSFHTQPLNVPNMLPIAEKIMNSFRFI